MNAGRSMLHHALILAAFAAAAAVLLGLVFEATDERIAEQQRRAERAALYQILPGARESSDPLAETVTITPDSAVFSNAELLGLRRPRTAYITRLDDDTLGGVILPAVARDGYSGDIRLLVGINAGGSISGVRVVEHAETPGLGDKIERRVSDWILAFNGRSLDDPEPSGWTVVKDGGAFDQFAGATITPRAVTHAVRRALDFFAANRERFMTPPDPQ